MADRLGALMGASQLPPGMDAYYAVRNTNDRYNLSNLGVLSDLSQHLAQQQTMQAALQDRQAMKRDAEALQTILTSGAPEQIKRQAIGAFGAKYNKPELMQYAMPKEKADNPHVVSGDAALVGPDGRVIYKGEKPPKSQWSEPYPGPRGTMLQKDSVTGEVRSVVGQEPKGSSTTVVLPTQEKKEAETVGKGFGEQFNDIMKGGFESGGKLARIDRMQQLMEGVKTGTFMPTAAQLAAAAQSFGINLDPKLGQKQALEALSNEMALQLRNPSGGAGMPGALSDADRQYLRDMVPGLAKTPEGNKLILEGLRKMAKRDQDVAKLARQYRTKHGQMDEGFYEELSAWSNRPENILFGNYSAAPAEKSVTDQADEILRRSRGNR